MENSKDKPTHIPSPIQSREDDAHLGALFAQVVDLMDIAILELDLEYRIKACNAKAMRLYGEDIIGQTCYAAAASADRQCDTCAAQRVYAGAAFDRSEHVRADVSDNPVYIDQIATAIYDAQGTLGGVLVMMIDISHQKKMEEALKQHQTHLEVLVAQRTRALEQSEQKYRALVMQFSDCLILHDLQGAIVDVNPSSCDTYGYTRDELLTMKVSDLDPDYNMREAGGDFWRNLPHKKPMTFNARQKKKDGTVFPVAVRLSLVKIDQQTLVLGLCRDISERLDAERERASLEAQIHQAQKLESIGRLAGGVAHDLNNLLSPILGYSELLLDDFPDGAEERQSLGEILSAANRARNLVGQLLAFSRKQALEFKAFDLNTIVINFQSLLSRTIREDIAIKMHLAEALPLIKGDIGQIEQVIMNLAVNAQDAMPGGGSLTIETSAVDLDEHYASQHNGVIPGAYVQLTISDCGTGMDEDTRHHVFEPFFTTKGSNMGTGLGLSTVYGIVKQHGGNIWVYSEPDMGATFKIFLPVSKEPVTAELEDRSQPSDLTGSETILLVEDNDDVRQMTLAMLERNGYAVLDAGNGRQALDILERYHGNVHLLLTDVIMPEINGKQLAEKIMDRYPQVEVIYMSGYTDNVIAHHGVVDEGVKLLVKPFSYQALLTKVREALDVDEA